MQNEKVPMRRYDFHISEGPAVIACWREQEFKLIEDHSQRT